MCSEKNMLYRKTGSKNGEKLDRAEEKRIFGKDFAYIRSK